MGGFLDVALLPTVVGVLGTIGNDLGAVGRFLRRATHSWSSLSFNERSHLDIAGLDVLGHHEDPLGDTQPRLR